MSFLSGVNFLFFQVSSCLCLRYMIFKMPAAVYRDALFVSLNCFPFIQCLLSKRLCATSMITTNLIFCFLFFYCILHSYLTNVCCLLWHLVNFYSCLLLITLWFHESLCYDWSCDMYSHESVILAFTVIVVDFLNLEYFSILLYSDNMHRCVMYETVVTS